MLGTNVRELRKARGWSQKQLAVECGGWHYSAISHIELGRRTPSVANLIQLANVLDVSLDTLVGRKHNEGVSDW